MVEQELDAIEQDAVAWFVRLHDEDATSADRAAHAQWLAADPRHRAKWAEVDQLWSGMEPLQGMKAPGVVPLPPLGSARQPVRRAAWRRYAAAAALVMMVGSASWMATQPGLFADERTAAGESRIVSLPDGSQVELATASALSVDFSDDVRRVVLHDGEAFFTVTHNPDRPFRVEAAGGSVTVLGTAFDVKNTGDRVAVAVERGRVEVAGATGSPVRLSPGETVQYGANGIDAPRTVAPDMIGLWREGRLAFENAPLPQVLHDLERYRRGRIVVMGSGLDKLTVTGMFDARQTDAALDTIEKTLPVRLVRLGDLLVLAYPAD